MTQRLWTAVALTLAWAGGATWVAPAAAATFIGPIPYTSIDDSPIFDPATTFLDDFEDGVLDLPSIAPSHSTAFQGATLGPAFNTDSVDADDGVIDGLGRDGWSFFAQNGELHYVFEDERPRRLGFVWTDGLPGLELTLTIVHFTGVTERMTWVVPGDGTFAGTTGDDLFFGVISDDLSIREFFLKYEGRGGGGNVLSPFEIDHLQFAFVPEPAGALLLSLGLAALGRRRRVS